MIGVVEGSTGFTIHKAQNTASRVLKAFKKKPEFRELKGVSVSADFTPSCIFLVFSGNLNPETRSCIRNAMINGFAEEVEPKFASLGWTDLRATTRGGDRDTSWKWCIGQRRKPGNL